MKRYLYIMFIISAIGVNGQSGDNVEGTLRLLSGDAAEKYLAPVVSAFGSNLNSGWVSSIPPAVTTELNIKLSISAQGSFFSDGMKHFTSSGNFRFNEQQARTIVDNSVNADEEVKDYIIGRILSETFNLSIAGPTIIGNKDQEVTVLFPGETYSTPYGTYTVESMEIFTGAKGFLGQIPLLPMAAVQLNVGTFYGTEAAFRFFPGIKLGDLGEYSLFGVGIITNPEPYLTFLKPLPFNLGLGVFYQTMEVDGLFESSATQFGFYASKQIGLFIPYGSITFESSSTTVTYEYEFSIVTGDNTETLTVIEKVDLESKNNIGLTLGSKFKFGFFGLFIDFKLAKTSTFNTGISFSF
ncbi:MAG: DUF6588 family protein [Ignavibacteriaceae bacterium]